MITLKQHNDIVQTAIKKNEKLEAQLKELQTKLRKIECAKQLQGLKDKEVGKRGKEEQLRITKIQKQAKDKVDSLLKVITTKDLEIEELKERLQVKMNIDERDKEHIIESFRKLQGRKPNSANDYKLMSIINHYEGMLEKNQKTYVATKKELENYQEICKGLRKQLLDKENQRLSENVHGVEKEARMMQGELDKGIQAIDRQKIMKDLARKDRQINTIQQENKQLRKRYEDLTKEYYKVVNQSGGVSVRKQQTKTLKPNTRIREVTPLVQENSLDYSQSVHRSREANDSVLSGLLAGDSIMNSRHQEIIVKLMQLYGIQSQEDIVPSAIQIDMAVKTLPRMEACLASVKTFLDQALKTNINFSKIDEHLSNLSKVLVAGNKNQSLIRQIQVALGVKRNLILQTIAKLRLDTQQYFEALKNTKFAQKSSLARQIQEFIEFFQLSEEEALPAQIMRLYEQLKAVDRFTAVCNKLLEKRLQTPECLEHILRVLQKMRDGQLLKN